MIISPDNEKLKLVRKLRLRKYREKLGLFVTEGEDLARAGLAAGQKPKTLLIHPDLRLDEAAGDLAAVGEPVEPGLLEKASALRSGTRVIGIWPQPEEPSVPAAGICVYLDRVTDPGNMGTIIRSVDALLEATIVAGPGTVDRFAPEAVRASMGSVFTQPVIRASIEATPEPRIATVPRGGDRPQGRPGPVTLCLGAERGGLSEDVLKVCQESWTIPLRESGPESLNVAIAAAICCQKLSEPSS